MQLFISYVPEAKPIIEWTKNFYTPSHQLLTQTLPQDVQYREPEGNIWLFTYSTTPKDEIMKLARWLSRFQVKILGKTEVEAILDAHYTKDNGEYIIVVEDEIAMIPEERLTVDTFDWVTVKMPLASFANFATLATQITVMFWGIDRNVVGSNVVLSHIESDNPMLWAFLTPQLISDIEAAGGSVLWI